MDTKRLEVAREVAAQRIYQALRELTQTINDELSVSPVRALDITISTDTMAQWASSRVGDTTLNSVAVTGVRVALQIEL